ncbi:MAG TPA: Rne/Rng family ribonuclease [Egibacteraceae bacterium]|nr:Rne/Rng family ribonuclease [Egibacteraceae bacterium]
MTDQTPSNNSPDDEQPRVRVRRRRAKAESPARESAGGEQRTPSAETAKESSSEPTAPGQRRTPDAEGEGESARPVIRRRSRKSPSQDTSDAPRHGAQGDAPQSSDDSPPQEATEDGQSTGQGRGSAGRRRSRRGGRGRGAGRSAAVRPAAAGEDPGSGETDTTAPDDGGPTRLQTRARRGVGSGPGRSGRSSGTGSGRIHRHQGGVSEETRRAITEGPPRRMLVSVGGKRTQIAVLEERTLVEHYVTDARDASYVGNIYMGRVQNVLPGMEAAFVDIGKGRNGVLYAGEVNYDEADLDGELPRIEERLKPGQSVLVQVTKDPMGTKGARLTQQLSIAGRYCVLAHGDGMLGISRKLTDAERERLRKILKSIKPDGYGLIVRTAAEGATKEQLEADVARLERIWDQINERAAKAAALEPIYEEPDLVIRVIRDVFGPEYSELIVDSEDLAQQVRDYLSDVSPEFVDRVAVHSGDGKLFDDYEVTNQIRRALEKKVWLASGGYLIIEKTEAMWVIDVNTGKFVGETNLEETVLRNNLEAAEEIARQLRLRDMGGIIVIDFVDMLVPANRDEVLKRFRRELARDKTKSRVMEISKLGLVQMTRKNVSHGLQESFTARCETCEGRGAVINEPIV